MKTVYVVISFTGEDEFEVRVAQTREKARQIARETRDEFFRKNPELDKILVLAKGNPDYIGYYKKSDPEDYPFEIFISDEIIEE